MSAAVREISGEFTEEERLHTALAATLRSNGASPEAATALLGKVARERTWEHLPRYLEGEPAGRFCSFTDYAQSPTGQGGLGLTAEDIRTLMSIRTEVERRPGHSARAQELIDYRSEVLASLAEDIKPAAKHGEVGRGRNRVCATNSNGPMTHDGIVARLKRDDPQLAESVVRGEVTANAAARSKGWRHPRVELRNPRTVAERIKSAFTPEQIAQLISALTDN